MSRKPAGRALRLIAREDVMVPRSEVASALAVRCLCTASHMRSCLDTEQEMPEEVRNDLTVAAGLLETVCSEIEQSTQPS
jgi:hypothetical protein